MMADNKKADLVTNTYCDGLIDLAAMDHVGPEVGNVLRDCAKQIRHLQAHYRTAQGAANECEAAIVAWLRTIGKPQIAAAIEAGEWKRKRERKPQ
jgi:hypothetical protein